MQNRAILVTLRAAAIVIIATGLNDVVAGAVPRYEPLWLYLAAIVLVSLLDGVILGVVTALLAAAFYALLFMPRPDAFSPRIAIPLGAAIGTALAASLVRGFIRSRRRPKPVFPAMPPLLETSDVARVADNGEVLAAIDELRAELRTAVAGLTAARDREGELEQRARSHAAEREAIELRARQLENERDSALKAAEEARARIEGERSLRTAAENLLAETRDEASTMAGRVAELELSLHEGERTRSENAARIAELERAVAEAARTLHVQTEQAAARVAELERTVAEIRAEREELAARLAEATAARDDLRARLAEIERASAESTVAAHTRAAQETKRADEAVTRVAELARALAEAQAAREASERALAESATARDQLTSRVAEIERTSAESTVAAHTRAAAETARADDAIAHVAELERALANERATRERLESEAAQFDTKLQTIATHLAADHEADVGQAVADREEARAEARRLRGRITELETSVARLESEAAQFDTKLQTIVTHLASDHEADLGQALSEKEEARAEARALSMKLAVLQRKLDEAQAPPKPAARPRILIVHPDADLRGNAGATLERAGYEVVGAADGLEALRVAIARQPEIVIAEGSMPKMDGRELCQLLKSQEKTAHIRVILLLRAGEEAPRGQLLPDEILRKPVPVETLKATLANLLTSSTR